MQQYFYTKDNVGKNYLSPYTNTVLDDNVLLLTNTLTDRNVVIKGSNDLLQQLIVFLKQGICDEELEEFLKQFNITDLMNILIQEGIIE